MNDIKELSSQTDDKDWDTKRKTHHQIKDLKQKIDKHELETQSTKLVSIFEEEIKLTKETFSDNDNNKIELKQLNSLETDWRNAIKSKEREKLEVINESISSLRTTSIMKTTEWMKYMLWLLYERRNESTDIIKSTEILNRCPQYIEDIDKERMMQSIQALIALLPIDQQNNLSNTSWITK
jgi:hypothetical protein